MTEFSENVVFRGNVVVVGILQFNGGAEFPSAVVTNAAIVALADIAASKLEHRHAVNYGQDGGTDVVTATKVLHNVRAAGRIKSFSIRPFTSPAGGDKQYTVDLQRAPSGSSSFVTLLSSVVTISSADASNTPQDAVLVGSPAVLVGDAIRVVVTASGSTGTQGQGFQSTINIEESGI